MQEYVLKSNTHTAEVEEIYCTSKEAKENAFSCYFAFQSNKYNLPSWPLRTKPENFWECKREGCRVRAVERERLVVVRM